jgi:hypothetical protein
MSSVFKRYPEPREVVKVLQSFLMCEATDSRDKIFALMGFDSVRTALSDVKIDYKIPIETLYTQVARIILDQSDKLDLLSYHWHSRLVEQINWASPGELAFPSWVPRWHQPPDQQTQLLGPLQMYNASGGMNRDLVIKDDVLRVTGQVFDTIEDACKIKWVDVSTAASRYVTLMAPMFSDPFIICPGGPSEVPSPEVIESFLYAITAGLTEHQRRAPDEYLKTGFYSWYNTLYHFRYNLFPEKNKLRFRSVRTPEWEEYQRSAYAITQGRAILMTKDARIGIGPLGTEEGDLVCLLHGGDVLYVLRPIDQYFVLVGEACFFGAMDGEIMKDEKKWPRRSFDIH